MELNSASSVDVTLIPIMKAISWEKRCLERVRVVLVHSNAVAVPPENQPRLNRDSLSAGHKSPHCWWSLLALPDALNPLRLQTDRYLDPKMDLGFADPEKFAAVEPHLLALKLSKRTQPSTRSLP